MLMEEMLYSSHGDADGATRGFGIGGVHGPRRRSSGAWRPSWTWASTMVTWRCFSPSWPRTGRSGPATSYPSTRLSSARGLLDPHRERTEAAAHHLVRRPLTGRL